MGGKQHKNIEFWHKVSNAIRILVEDVQTISHVQVWAEETGVSREWLYKSMKTVFKKSPKIILREVRYEKVVFLITERGMDSGFYIIALDAGFRISSALSKFLKWSM